MGRKMFGCCAPLGRGVGSLSNTMWPGPRPTSLPRGILIHPVGIGRPWPRSHCVIRGQAPPTERGTAAPTFAVYTDAGKRPLSAVTKRLDGTGCHLVRRQASVQATLCRNFWGVNSIGADPSTTLWGSTEMATPERPIPEPEGPNSEKRACRDVDFLPTGCSPRHQLRGLGDCCNLSQWGPVRGETSPT